MKALTDVLKESSKLVRETGQWILQQSSEFTSSDIIYKGTNDLVSFVDQQAEAKLKQGLSAIFPEAAFIAEETSSNYEEVGEGYYWVIDPLDGTTNFLHKLPALWAGRETLNLSALGIGLVTLALIVLFRRLAVLDPAERLAEVCDPSTRVIIVGRFNDIALYRELMRRGVSEYLVGPLQPLQLISAIGGLFADPAQPFVGRSIAFVGARGGCGSSVVAHNTAYAMSERIGANTVIVDYDLPFGTAGLDFNQDPLNGVADALGQPDRLDSTLLDRMMVRCTDKLSLFAAPAAFLTSSLAITCFPTLKSN